MTSPTLLHHSLTVMIQDILIDLIMLSANDTQQ